LILPFCISKTSISLSNHLGCCVLCVLCVCMLLFILLLLLLLFVAYNNDCCFCFCCCLDFFVSSMKMMEARGARTRLVFACQASLRSLADRTQQKKQREETKAARASEDRQPQENDTNKRTTVTTTPPHEISQSISIRSVFTTATYYYNIIIQPIQTNKKCIRRYPSWPGGKARRYPSNF
jgi:hypothetical protein